MCINTEGEQGLKIYCHVCALTQIYDETNLGGEVMSSLWLPLLTSTVTGSI